MIIIGFIIWKIIYMNEFYEYEWILWIIFQIIIDSHSDVIWSQIQQTGKRRQGVLMTKGMILSGYDMIYGIPNRS